jgi:hypothetical protein
MKFYIQFYDYTRLPNSKNVDGIRSIVPVHRVARRLSSSKVDREITAQDIYEAFDKWTRWGHPQECFHSLGTMDGTKKKYKWGLLIWNYQGGHDGDSGFPNEMGVMFLSRTWGKGYKHYDNKRESFNLGAVA